MQIYKIERIESGFPEVFPTHIWVYVQAIEKSSNLIRLFISKTLTLDVNDTIDQQNKKINKFIEDFVFRIYDRGGYKIIDYRDDLKFYKVKRGRKFYSKNLINNDDKGIKDI